MDRSTIIFFLIMVLFAGVYFDVLPLGSMFDDSHVVKTFRISEHHTWKHDYQDSFSHTIPACSHVNYVTLDMSVESYNREGMDCRNAYAEAYFNGNRLVANCAGLGHSDEDTYSTTILHNKIIQQDYTLNGEVSVELGGRTSNRYDTASAEVVVKVDYLIDSDCDGTPDSHESQESSQSDDSLGSEEPSFFSRLSDYVSGIFSTIGGWFV